MKTEPLRAFCLERESLRQCGATEDPILRRYHFCNVDREHDRVTRTIRTVVQPSLTDANRVWASALARLINRDETLRQLVAAGALENREAFTERAPAIIAEHGLNTRAYKLNTPLGLNKAEYVVGSVAHCVRVQKHLRLNQWDKPGLRSTVGLLRSELTPFISFQVALDLVGTPELPVASDMESWTHPGPGSWRGVRRLRGETLASSMWDGKKRVSDDSTLAGVTEREVIDAILQVHAQIADWRWWSSLSTTEHVLCEFDKYERIRQGTDADNKIRRKYSPVSGE